MDNEAIYFDAEAIKELEALDARILAQISKAKGTDLDAMYRFWIGEMTWQEQIDEVARVFKIKRFFPDRIAKSAILDRHFKIVRFR